MSAHTKRIICSKEFRTVQTSECECVSRRVCECTNLSAFEYTRTMAKCCPYAGGSLAAAFLSSQISTCFLFVLLLALTRSPSAPRPRPKSGHVFVTNSVCLFLNQLTFSFHALGVSAWLDLVFIFFFLAFFLFFGFYWQRVYRPTCWPQHWTWLGYNALLCCLCSHLPLASSSLVLYIYISLPRRCSRSRSLRLQLAA